MKECSLYTKEEETSKNLIGNASAKFSTTVEQYDHHIFYKALDVVISCIRQQFDQPGYPVYSNLQDLMKYVNGKDYEDELEFLTNFFGDDFNSD